MPGRRTALTPAVSKKILDALREGVPRETALAAVGIGRSTFYSWLAKARADEPDQRYVDFLDAVEKAEAEAVQLYTKIIKKAADSTWQAAAWMLERRWPDLYGRKDRLSIDTLKRQEAERISRELGIEVEEVMAAIDDILAGSN